MSPDVPVQAPAVLADPARADAGASSSSLGAQVCRLWTAAVTKLTSAFDWLFGLVSLVAGLAICASVPVLNLLSLGYLLHASGRVAATGKLCSGFAGIRKASRVGSFVLGTWLALLPLRFASGLWKDAELVDPYGPRARGWRVAVLVLAMLTAAHVIWACLRGGRLRHFIWPAPIKFWRWLCSRGKFRHLHGALAGFFSGLRLRYFFWLGFRGFAGALAWLAIPVGILVAAAQMPPERGGGVLSLLGGLLLAPVALHLPLLQARFALENRFKALFELGVVRELFCRAPLAFCLSLCATLLFALPLYLLKIELPPREIAWLPSLLFVVFIFPARLLTGWALCRAIRRSDRSHWLFRWSGRLALVPVALVYVLAVYLTQYLSWHGSLGLLEQHAFLVPAPLIKP